jgi:hypothetical protein
MLEIRLAGSETACRVDKMAARGILNEFAAPRE